MFRVFLVFFTEQDAPPVGLHHHQLFPKIMDFHKKLKRH